MTVAYPWVLWVTAAAAFAVVAAHLLSVSRPPELAFPTARFAPERTVPAVSRASRPTDLLLMLLRLCAVVCAGIAFAGVTVDRSPESVLTVIAIDDRVVADTAALRSGLAAVARDARRDNTPLVGIVSPFGTTSLDRTWNAETSALPIAPVTPAHRSTVPARVDVSVSLSALLLRTRRAAPEFAINADSIRLVVLTATRGALPETRDDALSAVRAIWPGRVEPQEVNVASLVRDSTRARDVVTVRAANDDVVRAAFTRWGDLPAASTRVLRDSFGGNDSVAAANGEAVVWWEPVGDVRAPAAASSKTTELAAAESAVAAVVANGVALVAPLRRTKLLIEDSTQRAIVWWSDGTPAAVEWTVGAGCVRVVGFDPPAGDALLSVSARGVLAALIAECGEGARMLTATGMPSREDSIARGQQDSVLAGTGQLATSGDLRASLPEPLSPLTRWLLVLAIALIALEALLARTRAGVPQ